MLKENWRLIGRIERIGDTVIILLAFFGAYYGREALVFWNDLLGWSLPFGGDELAPIKDYFTVLFLGFIGYMGSLQVLGAYRSMRLSSPWRLLRMTVISSLIVFVLLGASLFLLKVDLSRAFLGLFCGLATLLLALERIAVLNLLRYWRLRGRNFRNVMVCGVGEQALRLVQVIADRPELGIRVRAVGDVRPASELSSELLDRFRSDLHEISPRLPQRIVCGNQALERAAKSYGIDEVIFTDVVDVLPQIEEMILILSEQGVRTTLAADLFSIGMVKSGISYFGDIPLIHFQTPPGDRWELAVKRTLDFAAAGLLLVVLAPMFLVIAAAVKLNSRGPVFFRQRRVGLNGRPFWLIKFRSMQDGAEKQLEKLKGKNEMDGPVFKISNDPRVTAVGRFLRRYSLDELPQLWNVLRGEMSLVGPRPPVPGEVSLYERRDRRRLSMRPGMTCTWQVSGRNKIKDFESWVKLDLEYIDNWSLGRDMILLFRTIPAVLRGTGA